MSTPLGGFASGKADIRVGSLKCYDVQILDKNCNLNIPAQADIRGQITVEDTLEVVSPLNTCGKLRGKEKLSFADDTYVSGTLFATADEFTGIATFEGNANVCIEVLQPGPLTFVPTSVQITQCPCSGIIESVDPMTGNVNYCPAQEPPGIDVYRYSATDQCGLRHNITQYVCQQTVTVPPFLNNGCIEDNGTVFKFPITDYAIAGSAPLDLSSVVIVQYLTDTMNSQGCPDVVTGGMFTGPDPMASVTVTAGGMVCVAFPTLSYAMQIMLSIADVNGLVSNIGTVTISSTCDGIIANNDEKIDTTIFDRMMSFSVGAGINRVLVVGLAGGFAISGFNVTYNGVTLTSPVVSQMMLDVLPSGSSLWVFTLGSGAAIPTQNITITGTLPREIAAASFQNVDQMNPVGTTTSQSVISNISTIVIPTSSTQNYVVDITTFYAAAFPNGGASHDAWVGNNTFGFGYSAAQTNPETLTWTYNLFSGSAHCALELNSACD